MSDSISTYKDFWETFGRAALVMSVITAIGIGTFISLDLVHIPPDPPIQTNTYKEANGEQVVEHVIVNDCPSEIDETCSKPNKNERELRDLAAQEGMQGAAIGLLLVTVIQGVIGTIGLFFLWDTLRSTRDNAKAAIAAARATQRSADAAESAERAHVLITVEFEIVKNDDGVLDRVTPIIHYANYGKTPALEVQGRVILDPRLSLGRSKPCADFSACIVDIDHAVLVSSPDKPIKLRCTGDDSESYFDEMRRRRAYDAIINRAVYYCSYRTLFSDELVIIEGVADGICELSVSGRMIIEDLPREFHTFETVNNRISRVGTVYRRRENGEYDYIRERFVT